MKYQVGGTLTDANNYVHEIHEVWSDGGTGRTVRITEENDDDAWVDPTHYKYHPPVKPITIKPGDPLWEALEKLKAAYTQTGVNMAAVDAETAWQKAKEAAK